MKKLQTNYESRVGGKESVGGRSVPWRHRFDSLIKLAASVEFRDRTLTTLFGGASRRETHGGFVCLQDAACIDCENIFGGNRVRQESEIVSKVERVFDMSSEKASV